MPKLGKTALDITDLNLAELLVRLYDNAINSLVAQEFPKPTYQLTAIDAKELLKKNTDIHYIDEVCISINFDITPIDSAAYDTLYADYAKSAEIIIFELCVETEKANRASETLSDGGDTIVIHSSCDDDDVSRTPSEQSPRVEAHTNSFDVATPKEKTERPIDTHTEPYRNSASEYAPTNSFEAATRKEKTATPVATHTEPCRNSASESGSKKPVEAVLSPRTEEKKELTQEEERHTKKCCDKISDCFSGLTNSLSSLFAKEKPKKEDIYQKTNLDKHTPTPTNIMR